MENSRTRGRARLSLSIALSLIWLVLIAPPALAAGESCDYDGGTGSITVVGGAYNQIMLTRNGAGEVTVSALDDADRPVVIPCSGEAANLATSVTVVQAAEGWTDVLVYLENWTSGTSVSLEDDPSDADLLEDFDYLVLLGTDGADTIDGADPGLTLSAESVNGFVLVGEGGDDVITWGVPAAVTLVGTYEARQIFGDAGDDTVVGGDGNDYLEGGDGDDYLEAGDGNDQLFGWDGDDELHGGAGSDELDGGAGDDLVYGEAGDDLLFYGSFRDNRSCASPASPCRGLGSVTTSQGADLLDGGSDDEIGDLCSFYGVEGPEGARFSRVTYEGCEYGEF